jgi:DHA2 family multidrug resistance protein-like MFS transporter
MFVTGLVVFGASSLMAAYSPISAILIGARGLLAVGAAMMLPSTISIIRSVFICDHERAVAIGIWGSVSAGATALGPILGGFLLEHFWWGSVFLINVPVVLMTLLFTFIKIPLMPGNPERYWDALTSAILTISLIALLYALKGVLKATVCWNEVFVAVVVGIALLVWFLRRQRTIQSPLIDFMLFRNMRFSLGIVAAFFASFLMVGLQYVLNQELQLVRSFTPLQAGLFVLPIAAGAFVAGPVLGSILFRVGIERMMTFTLATVTLGIALYTRTNAQTSLLWQITTLVVLGFGLGGVMSIASTAIMTNAPESKAGMAGALEGISYELGGTLGVAIMGSLIASIYTQSFVPPVEAGLPSSAWDSLDQTLIAASNLPAVLAQPVIEAGKTAFLSGVSIILIGGSLLSFVLFILIALHVRKE